MDAEAFHAIIEDFNESSVVAHPDLSAGIFRRNGVVGFGHLDMPVAMDVPPPFLKGGEQIRRSRLQQSKSPRRVTW
jgi:hypothetical protein